MEEYRDQVRPADSASWAVPQRAGSAYAVGYCGDDGLVFRQGGQPCVAPVAWGAEDDADYGNVTGWVVVTDLAGSKDGDGAALEGRLLAAYWGGRIWLKLQAGGAEDDAPESAGPEEISHPDGSAHVGACGDEGLAAAAPLRPVYPPFYICPMQERESYLKTTGGQWRADVDWEVLANYSYVEHKKWILYDSNADAVVFASDRLTTIWMIPVGNVICFYTTSCDRYAGNHYDSPLNEFAARMRYSAFGRPYTHASAVGPFYPFWCAPLPWEMEGAAPYELPAGGSLCAAGGCLGTEGAAGRAMEDGWVSGAPAALAPGLYVCPRYHASSYLGIWWPLAGNVVLAFVPASAKEATGYGTWLEACEHYIKDDINTTWWFENGNDYLFDPWAVEAQGLEPGFDNAGHFTRSDWPAAAISDGYKRLAGISLSIGNSGHTLHLCISGAETADALLTSSLFATEMGNRDMDDGASPDAGARDPSGGGGGGAGSEWEDDGDGGSPLGGYYYVSGGGGVSVASSRHISADDVTYTFAITVSGTFSASQSLSWEVQVSLETENGGSYTYKGEDVDMYYGFSSETAGTSVTLNYKASYTYSDDDPKTCTCTVTLAATASLTASFPGSASLTSDDSPPGGSLFSIAPTGKSRYVQLKNGQRKKFAVYSISLDTNALQQMMKGKAIAQAPHGATVTPGSISGSGGNTSAPSVSASIDKTTLKTQGGSAGGASGFLSPTIRAIYNQASATISVSGSGSWHYDNGTDEEGNPITEATSGSISGSFSVQIPRTTTTL